MGHQPLAPEALSLRGVTNTSTDNESHRGNLWVEYRGTPVEDPLRVVGTARENGPAVRRRQSHLSFASDPEPHVARSDRRVAPTLIRLFLWDCRSRGRVGQDPAVGVACRPDLLLLDHVRRRFGWFLSMQKHSYGFAASSPPASAWTQHA